MPNRRYTIRMIDRQMPTDPAARLTVDCMLAAIATEIPGFRRRSLIARANRLGRDVTAVGGRAWWKTTPAEAPTPCRVCDGVGVLEEFDPVVGRLVPWPCAACRQTGVA